MSCNTIEYQESTWNGFRRLDFTFAGYPAILILPKTPHKEGRIAIKTEYFGAFPATEIAMLEAGYHVCYLKNRSRWGRDQEFRGFCSSSFGNH